MLAIATTLQFVLVYEFNDQCEGHDISTAPTVAGLCLLGSFLLNGIWLMARKRGDTNAVRAALFAWTACLTIGVAAAGAVLGQSFLYEAVCASLDTDINIELLQYISIALLVLSVAAPHAMRKKEPEKELVADSTKPILKNSLAHSDKPLVFL